MAQQTSTTDGAVLGTNGFDVFTPNTSIRSAQTVYGLGGTDILSSAGAPGRTFEDYIFNLVGGSGSTIYEVGDYSTAFIIEHPGSSLVADTNPETSDFDVFSMPNLRIDTEDTVILQLEGKHLVISDEDATQLAIIMFWREPENRLEEFRFADRTLSYEQFSRNLSTYPSYLGNLTSGFGGIPRLEDTRRDSTENFLLTGTYRQLLETVPALETEAETTQTLSDLNELILPEDNESENIVEFYRFQNQQFDSGTYLFAGEQERDAILTDKDLTDSFALEGDGNFAFRASASAGEDLEPFYRLRNLNVAGTYTFVGQAEYDAIFARNSSQRNNWVKEGLNERGFDIPDFYLYGAGSGEGTEFYRLQNNQNGTFLFAGEAEVAAIESNSRLADTFTNQGVAFESLI